MFSYYGTKGRVVNYYPKPIYDNIYEPFAGSARYALRYFEREVLLIDKSPLIVSIWNYLIQASEKEINSLPVLPASTKIEREMFDCDGQYHLMKFLIGRVSYGGNNVVSKWGELRFKTSVKNVASQLFKIRHWKIINGDYTDTPTGPATIFIDPPYQYGGNKYPYNNKKINYSHLAEWIRSQSGHNQVTIRSDNRMREHKGKVDGFYSHDKDLRGGTYHNGGYLEQYGNCISYSTANIILNMFVPQHSIHLTGNKEAGYNIERLKLIPSNSVDAIVTDCPYGFGSEPDPIKMLHAWITTGYLEVTGGGFMGKKWDAFVPQPAFWKEAFRVIKPGGYVLAFFGSRTYHWGAMAIAIAGFEIRDQMDWIYSSGFPKSLNVKKQFCDCYARCKTTPQYNLRPMPLSDISKEEHPFNQYGEVLQSILSEQDLFTDRNQMPGKGVEAGKESSLEGRSNSIQKEGELRECQICTVSGLGQTYGTEGRIYNGTSTDHGHTMSQAIDPNGSGSPHRSQTMEQFSGEPGTLAGQQQPQEIGMGEYCTKCGKPVSTVDYTGYGSALKPAHEPICIARKPLEGTIVQNVTKYGCGAINLDGCRISTDEIAKDGGNYNPNTYFPGLGGGFKRKMGSGASNDLGRFPANIILDEVAGQLLDQQTGTLTSGVPSGVKNALNNIYGDYGLGIPVTGYGDSGGASRFFYCAKSSTSDRNYGCDELEAKAKTGSYEFRIDGSLDGKTTEDAKNNHPTVKPIALMRYLCRLVKTPLEACTILDPFMGSGTTGIACMLEGINFIGCEMEERSFEISDTRIRYAQADYIKEQQKPVQGALF